MLGCNNNLELSGDETPVCVKLNLQNVMPYMQMLVEQGEINNYEEILLASHYSCRTSTGTAKPWFRNSF